MTPVEYEIKIVKTGAGATQAAQEFTQLKATADSARASVAAVQTTSLAAGTSLTGLSATTKTTREAVAALGGSLHLLAYSFFPQAAEGGMVLRASFHAVKGAAELAGVSLAASSATFAALAGAVAITLKAVQAFKAEFNFSNTAIDLQEANQKLFGSLQKNISGYESAGAISGEKADSLRGQLTGTESLRDDPAAEAEALHKIAGQLENINALQTGALKLRHQLTLEGLTGYQQESKAIEFYTQDVAELIAAESNRTGLDEDELIGLARKAIYVKQMLASEKSLTEEANLRREVAVDGLTQEDAALLQVNGKYEELAIHLKTLNQIGKLNDQEFQKSQNTMYRSWEIAKFNASSYGQIINKTGEQFSSGFATAIVDSFEQGGQAFKKFAQTFLKGIAEMILQTLILKAVQAGLNSLFSRANVGEGSVSQGGPGGTPEGFGEGTGEGFSRGGVRFAANGLMTVSRPTYMPKFNVIAGEVPGQPEMLTVLSRPAMMQFGGIQAAVGYAGGNKLAITNANDLARAGGSGPVEINISLEPGLIANITKDASQVAVIKINRDSKRNTDFSRNIKALVQ